VRELRDQVVRVRRDRGESRGRPAARSEDRQFAILEESLRRSSNAIRTVAEVGVLDGPSHATLRELARAFAAQFDKIDSRTDKVVDEGSWQRSSCSL
jgi:hypothetical protein